jgi:hypothetical protein
VAAISRLFAQDCADFAENGQQMVNHRPQTRFYLPFDPAFRHIPDGQVGFAPGLICCYANVFQQVSIECYAGFDDGHGLFLCFVVMDCASFIKLLDVYGGACKISEMNI